MATTKTIQPTGTTITIPAMTDKPDASVYSTDIDRITDAVNAENGKIATQSNTITFTNLPSNVASASCSYCKNGFLAQVNVSFSLNSGSTSDWLILGSVPVKPKSYITKNVVPDANNTSIPQARVRITDTGELRVFYGGPGNYYCSFVFFC